MAGNKNSGRKSARYESAKRQAIEDAWVKIMKEINKEKAKDIALPLALKDMVAKQDVTSGGQPIKLEFISYGDPKLQVPSEEVSDESTDSATPGD